MFLHNISKDDIIMIIYYILHDALPRYTTRMLCDECNIDIVYSILFLIANHNIIFSARSSYRKTRKTGLKKKTFCLTFRIMHAKSFSFKKDLLAKTETILFRHPTKKINYDLELKLHGKRLTLDHVEIVTLWSHMLNVESTPNTEAVVFTQNRSTSFSWRSFARTPLNSGAVLTSLKNGLLVCFSRVVINRT